MKKDRATILRELLGKVSATLSEERLRQLFEFAQFLSLQQEAQEWSQAGLASLEQLYGPDEVEYTEADIKPELNP
jgi:hypothetical protein